VRPGRSIGLVWQIVAVVLVINLGAAALALRSLYNSLADDHERIGINTRNLAQLLARDIEGEIGKTDLALTVLAREIELQFANRHLDAAALNRLAVDLQKAQPYLDAIRITDAQGRLRYGTDVPANSGVNLADRPHFQKLRTDRAAGLVRSRVQVSRANNKPVIVFARRVQAPDGAFGGMAFAAFSIAHFIEKFSVLDIGPNGSISLLDEDLNIVSRYPKLANGESSFPASAVPDEFKRMVQQGRASGTYVARFSQDQVERTSSFQRLATGLYIRTGLATDDFLSHWREERNRTLMALAGLLTLSIVAGIGVYRNLRQRLITTEALRQSQHPIVLIDPKLRFTYVNPAFSRLFGYDAKEVEGQPIAILQPTNGEPSPTGYQTIQMSDRHGLFHGRVIRQAKDGRRLPVLMNMTPVVDEKRQTLCYVADMTDLSDIERHELELEHSTQHDVLTGLPNRVLLRDRMQQALAQAIRRETLLAVCYLDLDGFKPINDTYGHKVGDRILVEVAQRLQQTVRTGDTAARLGGDEFVLLLPDIRDIAELEQVLQRLQTAVTAPCLIEGREFSLSASIGVALYPLDDNDADILLRHADKAMYAAKQAGKNRYRFFDTDEEQRTLIEQDMCARVRDALAAGEFRLHYQPKVDMRTGEVIGVEALIRWRRADGSLKLPSTFLPFVENNDVIIDLGNWVLHEAMRQMQTWQAAGVQLEVSVNLAARHLAQADFVPRLAELLAEYPDIPPHRLELEILESAALKDIAMVGRVIAECAALGVQFALDDFGTGYSTLTYLRRLPARALKIDQSFVIDMLTNPEDLAITDGVVGLARAFQRVSIAEGVESVRHGTLLLHLGCDLGQGFGISRPLPPEDLPQWLRDFRPAAEWLEAARHPWKRECFPLLHMEVEHRRWVASVVAAVEQEDAGLLPPALSDHRVCNFGRWLQGDGYVHYRELPEFKRIGTPHRRVHEVGAQIARLMSVGRKEEAQARLGSLLALRDEVLDNLDHLRQAVAAER
jgi:diguanylate cyclase (GGDEF)-like protein/PAS domain S-box-containing protein